MPELELDDLTLHYEISGDGPPLLLLAGMMGDSASWMSIEPQLNAHFTVIRPDNRASGRTRPWNAAISVAHMVADAQSLMSHLGHDRYHVAGHSLGGLMALELAGTAPEAVRSASVLASGRVRSPRTAAVFETLIAIRRAPEGEEMWLRALYPWIFGPAFFELESNTADALHAALNYPHAQSADAMAHQLTALRGYRPRVSLQEIACPVLVLYAEQDVLVPPVIAQPGFSELPNLTERTVEHAGHSIAWDAPEEVVQHLKTFITKVPVD